MTEDRGARVRRLIDRSLAAMVVICILALALLWYAVMHQAWKLLYVWAIVETTGWVITGLLTAFWMWTMREPKPLDAPR